MEFAPITIFAGVNSSGKSSVIQSIMLLMQTTAGVDDTTLQLNGELLSLGTVSDVWHNGVVAARNTPVFLQYALEIDDPTVDDGRFEFRFDFAPVDGTEVELHRATYRQTMSGESSGLAIELRDLRYWLTAVDCELEDRIKTYLTQYGIQLSRPIKDSVAEIIGLFPNTVSLMADRVREDINWDRAFLYPLDERLTDEDFSLPIPEEYQKILKKIAKKIGLPDVYERTQNNKERMLIRYLGEYREWFDNLPNRFVGLLADYLLQELKDVLVTEAVPCRIPFIDTARSRFEDFFLQSVRYLSANRIAPTIMFSPGATSQWSEVGVNGANIASALDEHGSRAVLWYDPYELVKRETTLLEAVATWLKFFGIIEDLSTTQSGKLGTLLTIRINGVDQDLDLTSVGFGTSQILPIIVQGLLTPPGGVFIVEQPEVHLHPSVQAQLALFFVALTRSSIQCIIETHSEQLVNQFRLFISDRRVNIYDQIRIYFAERHSTTGTYFREVELDHRGNISNWPKGFMDESNRQAEEMLRAILEEGEE